jgi:hypothetical protein
MWEQSDSLLCARPVHSLRECMSGDPLCNGMTLPTAQSISTSLHLLLLDDSGLQSVEVGDAEDGGSVGVQLLLGRLVVVSLP